MQEDIGLTKKIILVIASAAKQSRFEFRIYTRYASRDTIHHSPLKHN